ncbi:MAG TPA: putative peptidoglycan glycosyltransferase FtsW [Candidatus Marinimicrobia bacterium]|nr:putative peptidoglycan glycosyltransferase FtsW [Candidatus Neomarinimicrobiota bacterium]MDP6260789.1 putative peptidoglycan glycosyltransferase FtsW [Candidatus Neomarinimicrobiota bacterium]MDP7127826.1 putative peptidoglycan glycosyltransferase FtsW [Candidatus Neomarinimicrobiota bacterium]MDP7336443.1 putative peptidoglycan glycosyltransferase FtsW [Candidatus Neomarinimicrobiota bacterium]MDP7474579.1 putative peptidoglycan glycosyltransferase FtsW [Candidatus Neomarinimicrobiota bact
MNHLDVISKNYDRVLISAVILLCIIGTVMLYSASSIRSLMESENQTATLYLVAHLKRLLVGIIIMFLMMSFDYRHLKKYYLHLIFGAIGLLIITKTIFLIKGISTPARWFYVGSVSIQTSDIARLSLIVFLAVYIDKKRRQLEDFYTGFLPSVFAIIIIMSLIIIQPDFSSAIMLGLIGGIMLFIGRAKLSQLLATSVTGLAIAVPVLLMAPYRWDRIRSWWNRNEELSTIGYQAYQSLISLGNGGFIGLGLGNSLEKNMFLPEPHTDFIFSIIGEEMGFVGTLFILTLFLLVFQRGIRIAKECTDPFGVMLAVGISFSFILYAFVNAAVVTNVFPVTGLPMPLISYGGSGMVINLASMGILLNISQAKRSISHRNDWKPKLYG